MFKENYWRAYMQIKIYQKLPNIAFDYEPTFLKDHGDPYSKIK